jgi:hypothetical protein
MVLLSNYPLLVYEQLMDNIPTNVLSIKTKLSPKKLKYLICYHVIESQDDQIINSKDLHKVCLFICTGFCSLQALLPPFGHGRHGWLIVVVCNE